MMPGSVLHVGLLSVMRELRRAHIMTRTSVITIEKLNERYRILAKAFHPDGRAGDEESFKKMQAEYERLKKKFT
ncbi:MAG: J domain-containing protein [Lachnospiraceae bacterium]|nr:J domain-containing protein [Lachnospiraceae bacterium]